jgi:DNA sulfur modification protein DndD
MKLLSIQVKNFRSYYGQHPVVKFSTKKKVTLFHGAMGAGKTKLFNAIQWCLYNEEEEDENEKSSSNEDIINSKALNESIDKKNQVTTEVKLFFQHENINYFTQRKFNAFNGQIERKSDFSLQKEQPNGDYIEEDNPEAIINLLLPKHLRKYFMFDGEKISAYSKNGHEKEIQQAIKGLLGFDDITLAIDTLQKVDSDYNKQIKEVTNDAEMKYYIEEIECIKDEIDNKKQKQEDYRKENLEASELIEIIKKYLENTERAREYIQKSERLAKIISNNEVKINEFKNDMLIDTDQIYLTMGDFVFECIDELYKELYSSGQIPSGIKENFIQSLLHNKECICGRKLSEHSLEEKKLIDLLNKQNTALEDKALELPAQIERIRGKGALSKERILNFNKEISELENENEKLQIEINQINELIKNIDSDGINLKQQEREQAEKDIKTNKTKIEDLEYEIKKLQERHDEFESKKDTVEQQGEEINQIARQQKYAAHILKIISDFYETYEKETKEKVRKYTEKIFKEFMWKQGLYKEVVIDDNYVLDIYDINKRRAREGLSAGERQCFSLSFVIALELATERSAPFIVDTPLGRISRDPNEKVDPRVEILKALPKYLEQLILFVTYEEVREGEETEKALKDHVGYEYKLEFDEDNKSTNIKLLREE